MSASDLLSAFEMGTDEERAQGIADLYSIATAPMNGNVYEVDRVLAKGAVRALCVLALGRDCDHIPLDEELKRVKIERMN